MEAPELAGYALEAPAGPGPGPVTGRSRLDGGRVTVERLTGDAQLATRALGLSEALRRIDGRHVARVRAVVVAPSGVVHVVREHVEGPDVDGLRRDAGGTLDGGLAVRLLRGVLDGLADLHAGGLTHGALDAAAVRVDAAVPLRPSARLTGWGTAALLGRDGTAADDLRAAGRLLLLLATGSPDREPAPGLDRRLARALAALLPVDPQAEPDAAAARDALAAARSPSQPSPRRQPPRQLPSAPPPATAPPPTAPATAPPATAPLLRAPRPGERPAGARRRPAALLWAAAAAVLVLTVAAGFLLARSGDDGDARAVPRQPAAPAPYDFSPVARPDGLVVLRSWVLEQDGAVLRGTTVVRNDGERPTSAGVDEVVPKSVADDVDDLAFSPRADAILQRDPVVRFNVLGLAPGATTTWQFVVTLPAPVTADALPRLAGDAEQARLVHEAERRRALERARAGASPRPSELTPPPD